MKKTLILLRTNYFTFFSGMIMLIVLNICVTNIALSQWVRLNKPASNVVTTVRFTGNAIFTATSGQGILISTDNGQSWTPSNNGLSNLYINQIAISGNNIFAATGGGGVFLSSNNGGNWSAVNNGIPSTALLVTRIAANGNNIFAACNGGSGGLYYSANNGILWNYVGFSSSAVTAIAFNGNGVYVGTQNGPPWGVYYSSNNGTNWVQRNNGLTNVAVNGITVSGSKIYAATSGNSGLRWSVFMSSDDGLNWSHLGLDSVWANNIAVNGNYIYMSTQANYNGGYDGVYISTNAGANWYKGGIVSVPLLDIETNGATVYAGGGLYDQEQGWGIWSSSDNGADWNNIGITGHMDIYSMTSSGNYIFAGSDGGVFRSSDNGSSWTIANNGLPHADQQSFSSVTSFAVINNNIFAMFQGLYLSTNNGNSWTAVNNGFSGIPEVYGVAGTGNNIFAAVNTGIYKSTNLGGNWNVTSLTAVSYSIATSGNNVFAGTNNGIYFSSDNGNTWNLANSGLPSGNPAVIKIIGNNVYAGVGTGIYLSTNNGTNWNALGGFSYYISDIEFFNSNIFVSVNGGGVYLSKNNGINWALINQGFITGAPVVNSLTLSNGYIFAGISRANSNDSCLGVWKRTISEVINVQKISQIIPDKYELKQNYPNPFNPNTIIRFQIKDSRFVTLKVYDILGKEVATLVNEKLNAGTYEVPFSISSITNNQKASGVYFYRLETGNFTDVKRMILIK